MKELSGSYHKAHTFKTLSTFKFGRTGCLMQPRLEKATRRKDRFRFFAYVPSGFLGSMQELSTGSQWVRAGGGCW